MQLLPHLVVAAFAGATAVLKPPTIVSAAAAAKTLFLVTFLLVGSTSASGVVIMESFAKGLLVSWLEGACWRDSGGSPPARWVASESCHSVRAGAFVTE